MWASLRRIAISQARNSDLHCHCLPFLGLSSSSSRMDVHGKITNFIGQDPVISNEAGRFSIWLVPALFGYATLQALVRYFQTQSLIMPLLLTSCAILGFHMPLCWVLVFKSRLGSLGVALAIGMSYWLNVIILGLYMKYSSACEKTCVPVSMEVLAGIGEFFRFPIPSAIMIW